MGKRRRTLTALLALATLFPGACGGENGDDVAESDGGIAIDAQVADADPASFCTKIEASYPDLGLVAGTGTIELSDPEDELSPKVVILQFPLDEAANPDTLFVELWEDTPPFGELSAGSYVLGGEQSDLIRCGLCVYIAADYEGGTTKDFRMSYSGTVDLESLVLDGESPEASGTLSDLKLRTVTISSEGQEVPPMGCRATLDSLEFDLPLSAL